MIKIGIDPGTRTGVAVINEGTGVICELDTLNVVEAIFRVDYYVRLYGKENIRMWIEDANLRTWIPRERDLKARVGRAKGAGVVCAHSNIWMQYCHFRGIAYEAVRPRDNVTKMNSRLFREITGWDGRTSSHARDACLMILNR